MLGAATPTWRSEIMFRRMPIFSYMLMLAMVLSLAGCKSCRNKVEDIPAPPPEEATQQEEPEVVVEKEVEPEPEPVKIEAPAPKPPTAQELNARGVLRTVYFAFDSSTLSEETRAQLRANADFLKNNSDWNSVVLGGHCDERGTKEYNLALGERRASAARDYLASLGVDTSKLRVISYGEEDPVQEGHNESAWKMNRRCTFTFE